MTHFKRVLIIPLTIAATMFIAQSSYPGTKPITQQNSIRILPFDKTKLPMGIMFKGKMIEGIRWTDKSGEHIVMETQVDPYENKKVKLTKEEIEEDGYPLNADIYIYNFVIIKNKCQQIWMVHDCVHDCSGSSAVASFVKNALQVTDLNHNGIAEVWAIYKIQCMQDAAPMEMKLVMHEGQQIYRMAGEDEYIDDAGNHQGGTYEFKTLFKNAPDEFTGFAIKLWEKNKIQDREFKNLY
jgi:hypothetical protein